MTHSPLTGRPGSRFVREMNKKKKEAAAAAKAQAQADAKAQAQADAEKNRERQQRDEGVDSDEDSEAGPSWILTITHGSWVLAAISAEIAEHWWASVSFND